MCVCICLLMASNISCAHCETVRCNCTAVGRGCSHILWIFANLEEKRSKTPVKDLPTVWQENHTLLDKERSPKQFPVQIQLQTPLNAHCGLPTYHSGGVKNAGGEGWELLLDAAMLKNIMHTFPSRSLLGNTDTVWFLVSGSAEWEQHSAAPWLHCGCVGWAECVCGDFVRCLR